MYTPNIIAAGALLSMVAAVPLQQEQKRDIVWVTQTQEDVVTMDVTQTVWLEPGETPPSEQPAHYGHHHHHHHTVTSHIKSTVTVPFPTSVSVASVESSSSPSSTYIAPSSSSYSAPSSSSVYVAPSSPSSSSVYVAPSSTYVAPTTSSTYVAPSSTYVAPSSTSVAPAPSASSYGGGSSLSGMAAPGTSYTGDLTYYADGLGACGITSTPDQSIVAVSEVIFDSYATANPNDNPICGKTVTISSPLGGSYTATIVDRCTGCDAESLDLSQGFFQNFGALATGRLTGVSWKFD